MFGILRRASRCEGGCFSAVRGLAKAVAMGSILAILEGETLTLVGESGCGKSTVVSIDHGTDTAYGGLRQLHGQ